MKKKSYLFCLIGIILLRTTAIGQIYTPAYGNPTQITAAIPFQETPLATGKYIVIHGKNNANSIKKPFIIVEGFDPLNTNGFPFHVGMYNIGAKSLLRELYENNYDVIILDFDNGGDYIQNNGYLLISLIEKVNAIKSSFEENIVLGFSMGGLVTRYALTYMENKGLFHQTKLYISHDSPHKGANLSIGLQHFLKDWIESTPGIVGMVLNATMKRNEYMLKAALQMLVYHFDYVVPDEDGNLLAQPHYEKIKLFDELYNLSPSSNGYPKDLKKIAIANGSQNGLKQSNNGTTLEDGDVIFSFNYSKSNGSSWIEYPLCRDYCCSFWDFKGCTFHWPTDGISSTVRSGFPTNGDPLDQLSYGILAKPIKFLIGASKKSYFSTNNISYDNIPGSTNQYLSSIEPELDNLPITSNGPFPNLTFIPTFSALDLDIGPNQQFNSATDQCHSPFDFIHAGNTNQNHLELSEGAKNFILSHCGIRTLTQNIAFSENYTIPSQAISAGQNFYKKASNNITNESNFIIESTGNVSFLSGNSIILKNGFNAKSGAIFNAKIETIGNSNACHKSITYNPHYVYSIPTDYISPIGRSSAAAPSSEGMEIVDFINPLDSLPSIINDSSDVKALLQKIIHVSPSPTTGIINISFTEEFPLSYVKIGIYNSQQLLAYRNDNVTNFSTIVDLSNNPPGWYYVQFLINAFPYTVKVYKE